MTILIMTILVVIMFAKKLIVIIIIIVTVIIVIVVIIIIIMINIIPIFGILQHIPKPHLHFEGSTLCIRYSCQAVVSFVV